MGKESGKVHLRALNTLTHGLSYIMRYIFLVILSNNSTRLRLVPLLDKMTRKIYLIMYSRPCVNANIIRFPRYLGIWYSYISYLVYKYCTYDRYVHIFSPINTVHYGNSWLPYCTVIIVHTIITKKSGVRRMNIIY